MKTLTYFSLLILVLSSCKKNFICSCPEFTLNGSIQPGQDFYFENQKKDVAESACDTQTQDWNDIGGPACELKNN
tara:strand:+ start:214 stop:438 length:225 start_codon:yes stop_codon:yes gene_type:complete